MITEISSLITSTKAAYEIAKGISALKSEVDKNESISKILEVLLAVQKDALSVSMIAQQLQEEKSDLSKKLLEFEKWSETEEKYELKEIAKGIFVYSYKMVDPSSKPMHWLCPKCFQEKKAHIIQLDYDSSTVKRYCCPNCKTVLEIQTPSRNLPPGGRMGRDSWM